jgi:hypothetical protein
MRTNWCIEVVLYLSLLVAISSARHINLYAQAEQLQYSWFVLGNNQRPQLQGYLHFLDMGYTVRSQIVEMQ